MDLTVDMFKAEIGEALRSFDKYVVCIAKTPEECEGALQRLVDKAIKAYQQRAPGLRHGIALDNQLTIILSQPPEDSTLEKPLCGIYFNLSSPYHKKRSVSQPAKVGK